MSRFEFGGHGDPIPNIAMPDPNFSTDLPIQVLELVDGEPFLKADWVALGYTHFEVWCIGAVGGKGGIPNAFYDNAWEHGLRWQTYNVPTTWPDNLWAGLVRQQEALWAWENYTWYIYEFSTVPGHTGEVVTRIGTAAEYVEQQNPTHATVINHYHDPYLVPFPEMQGGGGGGGGLHVVSGALTDIPDIVPVSVGHPGADGAMGQVIVNGSYTPHLVMPTTFGQAGYWGPQQEIDARDRWLFSKIEDNTVTFTDPPQPGGDGGASAFGDICMASGGKGGKPSIVWESPTQRVYAGYGGDGGIGGRTLAGGGALGSISNSKNGQDGTWNGEIGSGGGGGRGGVVGFSDYLNYYYPTWQFGPNLKLGVG